MVKYFTNNLSQKNIYETIATKMTIGISTFKILIKGKSSGFTTPVNPNVRLSKSVIVGVILLMMGVGSVKGQISQIGGTQSTYIAGGTNISITKPSGLNIGDIMIATIAKYKNGDNTIPSLTGWTVISKTSMGGGSGRTCALLYRIVDGSEGATFTFALGTTNVNFAEGSIIAFTGNDHTTPFDVAPGSITSPGSSGTTLSATGITTVTPNALVLVLAMSSSTNTTARSFTWSITSPTLTELYDISGLSTVSVGAATGIKSTPGATGAAIITASLSAYFGGIILALRPQKQFRSKSPGGNWNVAGTWEQSTDGGTSWITATSYPSNTDGSVNILNGHTVTLNAAATSSNLTVDGTLDVNTYNLVGTGTMTVTGTGSLLIGGASNFPTGFTTSTLNSGSTVNYDNTGAQTISGIAFSNLSLSGSGIKTLQTGTTSISGNLILSGTAITTAVVNLSIAGDLNIGSGTSMDLSTFTANRSSGGGTLTVAGTLILGNNTGGQSGSNFPTNFTTLTLTGGTVNYDKSNGGQTIFSTPTYNHLTLGNTSGSQTAGGNLTVLGNLVINSGATFLAGTYTHAIGGNMTGGSITASTSTINLNGTAQTVTPYTFNNLTLSVSGVKTFATAPTINGILSMEGTATISIVPTYGSSATLQYNTSTARTAGVEWPSTFSGAGGIIIGNTGAITMNSNEGLGLNAPLTINNLATLKTADYQLTLGGNFTNNGTFVGGNAAIVITNTATTQSIDGFTTTGTVFMTKTGGTATFQGNINGGLLTVNGIGGTLNLGTGLSHTITGAITMTNGTLLGSSSTLNILGTIGFTGGAWNQGTSTVNYGGTVQNVLGAPYYNLSISGSGIKTLSTGTTIQNNYSISSSAQATAVESLTIPGSFTISGTAAYTIGSFIYNIGGNWINNGGTFNATGSTINLNGSAAQTIGGSASTTFYNLTINNTNGGVLLNSPVTVGNTLTLTNGILNSSSNLISITNTNTSGIAGGSATSFINGPVKWSLPNAASGTYNFPTGSGTTYLPFALVSPTTTGTATAQVQATAGSAGGTYNASLISLSTTEYWSLATTGSFTNSAISLSRPSTITPLDAIGASATLTGQYVNLNGTTNATGVTSSDPISANRYFVIAAKKQTITTGTIGSSSFCPGATVSVPFTISGTFTAGNVFTAQLSNSAGSFISAVGIGNLTSTAAGTITATIPLASVAGAAYRIRVISTTPSITGTDNGTNLTVNTIPGTPTTTGAFICIGSSATLAASGATTGNRYTWYDAASGGTLLKTSTNETDNTYTTATLGATTNYWVSILNASGCEGTRTQVTATYPVVSTDDQSAAGTDSWIGHVYDGTNEGIAFTGAFTNYYGHYTEAESFDQSFGGDLSCFNITSNSISRSIYTDYFSVRYRMNSTKKGLYAVNIGSDDGGRLSIDGTLVYSDWGGHAVNDHPNALISLTGNSSLVYDYFENGGGNRVYYQNPTLILANTLSTNTTQSVFVGNTGAAISGDTFGALPGNITLSGTGYQWTYSTTPVGARTNISGATAATYSPNTLVAPFSTPGVYYLYRNAILSSTNNVSPNPYVGTNESNAVVLTTVAMPVITISPATLTAFSYPVGYGPSTQSKSFTVSAVNLTANLLVLPTDSFEISLNSGASFDPQSLITLSVNNGTVASTTIYVRMKAGLAIGSIAVSNITCTSDNALTKTIGCSGTVTAAPVVNVTPTTLTGFTYMYTNGPSTQKTFAVSGTSLMGNVIVTPPADFEISTVSNSSFQSTPITITASGTLSSTTIYVRMKSGVGVGPITENIVVSSLNTTSINVSCSGTVTPAPTILNSISTLSTFIYSLGSGPSGEQTFTVIGTNLSTNITVTPPTNYEISTTSGSGFQLTPISLAQSGGALSATIYVRLKAGLSVADYNLSSIVLTSTGATTKSVSCSGSVVNTATILVSKSSITGFGYQASGGGPSSAQMVTVSGSSLASNISVAPPASYYEISLSASSGYQTTAISLPLTSGRVNPTIIYIRLKQSLVAGDYTGNITVSAGIPSKTVSLVGKVFASPLIAIGGGGFYCLGSTINLTSTGADIQNRYWEGPNSFYSVLQNPSLTTNATVGLSGTYTVTGNVTVGGNLITNGDFESGNTSFGSNYNYVAPVTDALQPEGVYTIVKNPNSVHSAFTTNGDHTSTTGYQMVINGSPTAGVVVWSQSVPVLPGASYQFTYWLQSVTNYNPSQLQLYVNGVDAGPVNTASTTIPLWTQFLYNAVAGSNTVLNLELINQNTVAGGNDFAIDDIVFQQILSATASTDITVAASVPVGVSVAASANPVIQGVTVTYTATPVNGGATPVYAWYVNSVLVPGITGSTYSYVPINNDKISCVLTSSISCVTNNPASSNTVTMTVNVGTNYWIGTTSTDWGTASNWTAVKVPLAGDNVVYATTLNNNGSAAVRDLYVDGDRTIGSLINATTKRLVIPTNKSLTVNNTITTNGSDSLIYIFSNSIDANGSLIFHNASGAPVHATVEMYSKAFYDELGATNQKYHWQYFGIPVSQVTASPTFDGSYLRSWDETGDAITNHWISLTNGSVLQPFLGYEITQKTATTIVYRGQLVNTDFNSGQLSVTPSALFPGQHVYANPYTAAIDIRQLTFGAQTEATVYLYNTGTFDQWTQSGGADNPGTGAGQYVSVPKNTAGFSGLPRQVPSMQAILVKALSLSTDATFGITYNTVIMNNTDPQRAPGISYQPGTDKVSTLIDVKGTNFSDKMWLFTQPGCTKNFDNGWDGAKMPGIALTPQIFAIGNDGNYQVNAVDDINNTYLGFQAGQDVAYTLTFTHQNLKSRYEAVYLVDLIENKAVDITESGSTYSFNAESTPTSVKRFMIATRNIEKDSVDKNTQLKVFSTGNTAFVQNLGSLNGEMNIYNMSGRCIKKAAFGPYGVTAIQVGTIQGAYVVNATTNNERVSKRIILGR